MDTPGNEGALPAEAERKEGLLARSEKQASRPGGRGSALVTFGGHLVLTLDTTDRGGRRPSQLGSLRRAKVPFRVGSLPAAAAFVESSG